MTNEFVQVAPNVSANVYGSTLSGSFAEPLEPPNFKWVDPPWGALAKSLSGKIGFWEVVIEDLRGPQSQDGKFNKTYAGWSTGSLDCRFCGYAIAPLKVSYKSFTSGAGTYYTGFAGVNFDTVFVMAGGDTANTSLFKETSNSDPTPVAVVYNPGSEINGLGTAPIGGATAALRLFILRQGASVDVHSAAGTSLGAMNASLSPAYGMALSPVNAATPGTQTIGFLANGGLWTTPITAAIGTAPTQTLSNLPNGGTMLGFETLEKSPYGNRCYMLLPEVNVAGPATRFTVRLRVAHVNVEFVDLEWIQTDLAYCRGGRLWQRNLILHDYQRVVRFDGERAWDLGIFNNIAANSNIKWTVVQVGGSDTSLRVLVQKYDISSYSASTLQWWEFMPQTNSWTPVSEEIVPTGFSIPIDGDAFYTVGLTTVNRGFYAPWSKQTGACYVYLEKTNDQSFAYQLVPPQGVNPYNTYRKTGTTDYASRAFTNGSQTLPRWTLPTPPRTLSTSPATGHPLLVDEIDLRLTEPDGGGTSDAYVKVEVANQAKTSYSFPTTNALKYTATAVEPILERRRTFYDVNEPMQKLQLRISTGQDTGQTNKTGNALPIVIRGHVCYDDIPRTYNEIEATTA